MDSSIGVKGPVIALPVNYWRALNFESGHEGRGNA